MTVDLRSSATRLDAILRERLDHVVPLAMERADLDAWLIIGREYAEGPVLRTMLPATWLNARRRTVLLFRRDRTSGTVDRCAVARYEVEGLFPAAWDPDTEPDQWARIAELVAEGDPQRIGVDTSAVLAHGDGLTANDHAALVAALPAPLRDRLVSAQVAAQTWLETRVPDEVEVMREACTTGHDLLARAYSREVITPGTTTTEDVVWWLRQQVHDLGLGSWFQPTVRIQRAGQDASQLFVAHPDESVIAPGDLLHIDFGVVQDRLCTDQQQHAYVLPPGESAAPQELTDALRVGNRLQDLLLAEFAVGRTGDELLASTRAAAEREGITGKIYSHPLGLHGHAAGPAIGLWDNQVSVPGTGGLLVQPNTCWSIELAAYVPIPGWPGGQVAIMLEEDVVFDGERVDWLAGRQTDLHLVVS